jgi:hypothetical protein
VLNSSASVPMFDQRMIKTSHAIHRMRPTSSDSDGGLVLPQSATNTSRTRSYMNNYDWATLKNDENTLSTENNLLHKQTTTLKARLHRVERECWTQLGKNDTLKDALGKIKKNYAVSSRKNKKYEAEMAMLHATTSKEMFNLNQKLKQLAERVERAEKDSTLNRKGRDTARAKLAAHEEMLAGHPSTRLRAQVEMLDAAMVGMKQQLENAEQRNKDVHTQLQHTLEDLQHSKQQLAEQKEKMCEQATDSPQVQSRGLDVGMGLSVNVTSPHGPSIRNENPSPDTPTLSRLSSKTGTPKGRPRSHSSHVSRPKSRSERRGLVSPLERDRHMALPEDDVVSKNARDHSRRESATHSTGGGPHSSRRSSGAASSSTRRSSAVEKKAMYMGGMFSPSGSQTTHSQRSSLKKDVPDLKREDAAALERDAFAAMVQRNDHSRLQTELYETQTQLVQANAEMKAAAARSAVLAERDEEQTRIIEELNDCIEQHEVDMDRMAFSLSVAQGEKKEKVARYEDMRRTLSDVREVQRKEREDAKLVKQQHNVVEKVLGLWLQLEIQRRKRKQRAKNLVKLMQNDIGLVADDTSKKHPDFAVSVGRLSSTSPSWRAGVRRNDVITSFGGKVVKSKEDCKRILTEAKPGMTLAIELLRKSSGARGVSMFGSNPEDLQRHRCEVYVAARGYPEDAVDFLLKLAYEPSDNNMEVWLRDLKQLKGDWLKTVVSKAEVNLEEMARESNRAQPAPATSLNSMLNSKKQTVRVQS